MTGKADAAILSFLVEDVILTLGTARGALGWLGSDASCPPAVRAEGFARITRQIAALEDRARNLWAQLRTEASAELAEDDAEITNLFLAPIAEEAAAGLSFRTGRAGA
jgi:hypothetical protein